jgi:hypothetical protein
LACAAAQAADVFVVSDIYGIKPDGTCFETASGAFGDLATKNCHWDAATKTVKLFAARNEEVAVQIVIPEAGQGYTAEASDLKGPGVIPGSRVSFSMIAWTPTRSGALVPDLVIPLDGSVAGVKALDVPVAVKGLPEAGNKVGVMLCELWAPKEAPAGAYTGSLRVLKAGQPVATLNVALTVLAPAFPDRPTFAFDLLAYGVPSAMAGHNWVLVSGDGVPLKTFKAPDQARKFDYQAYKLALDNRCFINVLPYHSQRGAPRFAYPVAGQGAAAKITSFAEFDDYFGPLLDGKLNKFGKAPAHFTLAFNVNYPHVCNGEPAKQFNWEPFNRNIPDGPGKNPALKDYEDTNKAIGEQTFAHFAKMGWKDTAFEFYHNQKGDGAQKGRSGDRNRIANWKLDEPVTKDDYNALRYLLAVNRWSAEAGKALGVKSANRIDIGHWHCDKLLDTTGAVLPCYKGKAYDKANAKEVLAPIVDHWVIGITHLDGAMALIKDYVKPGVKMMSYGTQGGELARNGCGDRGEGFRGARRGTVGHIVYKLDLRSVAIGEKPTDEFVMYAGTPLGFDGVVCSKRVKSWRSAVNDYEYFALAQAKNAVAAQSVVEKMTLIGPTGGQYGKTASLGSSNNPEDYLAARLALAGIATGKALPGSEIRGRSKDFTPASAADKITGYD